VLIRKRLTDMFDLGDSSSPRIKDKDLVVESSETSVLEFVVRQILTSFAKSQDSMVYLLALAHAMYGNLDVSVVASTLEGDRAYMALLQKCVDTLHKNHRTEGINDHNNSTRGSHQLSPLDGDTYYCPARDYAKSRGLHYIPAENDSHDDDSLASLPPE
jgi:hypothetical protein